MLSGTCAELGQPLIMTGRVLFWPPWGEEAEEAREGRELEERGQVGANSSEVGRTGQRHA